MLETTNIEINTTKIKVPNNDLEIDAYLAQPAQNGTFGAVIVFPEIFGINRNIRDITELIAKQGYIAIAPAMYQRIAPDFEADFSAEAIALYENLLEQQEKAHNETLEQREAEKMWIYQKRQELEQVQNRLEVILSKCAIV
ncbi:dienelactone hydrolase family protein [Nostoc sp.]